jgi:hypothetical protein
MPTEHRGTNASSGNVITSVGLLVGLVIIVIVVAWVLHRIRPPVTVPLFLRLLRIDEERYQRSQKSLGSYILESLPVVRYSATLYCNEQERASGIHDLEPNTHPLRGVLTTIDGTQSPSTDAEPAVITRGEELRKNTTINISCTTNNNVRIPLKADEADVSQNGDRLVLRHEPLSCSICTEDFVGSDNVRILPCDHIYHRHCIDPWLLDFAGTCPLW